MSTIMGASRSSGPVNRPVLRRIAGALVALLLATIPAGLVFTHLRAADNLDALSSSDNRIFDKFWDRRFYDGAAGYDGFITWFHNPAGMPASLVQSEVEDAIEAAFDTWDAVDDGFPENPLVPIVNFAGATATNDAFALDGENAVVWKSGSPAGNLALTPCWHLSEPTTTFDDGSGTRLPVTGGSIPFPGPPGVTYPRGTIIDCGIEIDSADAWAIGQSPGAFDLQSLATHEGGHFLGLSHSTVGLEEILAGPSPLSATMVPGGRPNDISLRTLEEDDKAAVLRTYARTASTPVPQTVGGRGVIQINLKKGFGCAPATGLSVWAYLTAGGLGGATRVETFSGSELRAGILQEPANGSVTLNVPPGGPYTIYAQTLDTSGGASATPFSAQRYNSTTIHSNTLDAPGGTQSFDNLASVTVINAGETVDLGDIGILGCWVPDAASQIDLVADSVAAPASAFLGSQIAVTSSFTNEGTQPAGPFEAGFYFSQDAVITTGDTFSGFTCSVPGLAAGNSATCNGNVPVPSLPPGNYFVGMVVDIQNDVGETSESNNGIAAPTAITLETNPLNPLVNGSFETGDFSGWSIQELQPASNPNLPLTVGGAGVEFPADVFNAGSFVVLDYFGSAPTDGQFAALHDFNGDDPANAGIVNRRELYQDVTLPSGTTALRFDYRAAWELFRFGSTMNRTFGVEIEPAGGGSTLLSQTILNALNGGYEEDTDNPSGGGPPYPDGVVDLSAFAGQDVRIKFVWNIPEPGTGFGFFQLDNVRIDVTEGASPPSVAITSPADGSTFLEGDSISFAGTASDAQDGDLTSSLSWSSSLDAAIGNGGGVTASLSVGVHTITASVTDSHGQSGSDSITVTVLVNEPPAVTITSPPDLSSAAAGTNVAFAGTAVDPEDGDLTANLTWNSNIDGPLGSGGSLLAPLSAGVHTITASATDTGGKSASGQVTVIVQAAGGGTVLFSDNFSGSLANWTVVDEGTNYAPSNWFIASGVLRQTSNIYGGSNTASVLPKPGTYLLAGDPSWTNYTFGARMSATDDDGIGVMFRYQDSANYYRFSMDSQRGFRRLVKNVGGVFTLLFEDAFTYQTGQWYHVQVVTSGGTMLIYIDGVLWTTLSDTSLPSGRIALYSWGNDGVSFDDVSVIEGVDFDQAPSVTITNPADGAVVNAGAAVSFSGSANDVQDGDLTSGLAWTSSIDGSIGSGGAFSAVLSPGLHTIRAAVTDSDGLSGDHSILLTINSGPEVTITSPANGTPFSAGEAIPFVATAQDSEDGDLSASIAWSSDLDGAIGTGSAVSAALTPGTHTITASATDSGGLPGTDQVTVIVQAAGGGTALFSDDFNGPLANWTVVDEGTAEGPSNWFTDGGVLRQTGNIYGGSTSAAALPKPGTFLAAGNNTWTNYTFSVWLRSTDDDGVGVMFRHQDNANYYRFSMDSQRGQRRLVKNVSGTFSLLLEDAVSFVLGQWYHVQVAVSGDRIQISLDGELWATVTDASVPAGGIALYSWGNDGLSFDVVNVVEGGAIIEPPEVTISSPADGSSATAGSNIAFEGTAIDSQDGDVSAAITWTSSIDGALGTGASLLAPLSAGVHTITATATDSGGLSASESILVIVQASAGGTILFSDDFSGSLSGWTVVDEGTTNAPSNWFIDNGVLRQTSNIYGGSLSATFLPMPGTYLLAGDAGWTDYSLSASVSATDDDGMGVMFRYQDANNYYRLSMDSQRGFRRLVKNSGGAFSVLFEDSVSFQLGQWYQLQVLANGSTILIYIDGALWTTVNDASLPAGRIALYSWGNNGLSFDDVTVVQGASFNEAPTVLINSPADGLTVTEGDTVNLAGTADDPQDGDLTSSLSWSSNIDGALGTGGSLAVTLSKGGHTITASVTDSGGFTGSRQILVTVESATPPLLSDDFSGTLANWTAVDEGTTDAPSNWFVDNGVLRQTSNIYGGSLSAAVLPKPGTYLAAGDAAWTDYSFSVRLRATDDDGIGVMFRLQDSDNYYRFSMDAQRKYRRLVKKTAGTFTLLAEDTVGFQLGQWYELRVAVSGGTIQIFIDGQLWNTVTDAAHPAGRIALYSWGNNGLSFDDVVVE